MPTFSPSLHLPIDSTPIHLPIQSKKPFNPLQDSNTTLNFSSPNPIKLESKKTSPTTSSKDLFSQQSNILVSCTKKLKHFLESKRLEEAMNLYLELKSSGVKLGIIIQTMLIDAFMKSGWLDDAFEVFEAMCERNVVTWTSMIAGCVLNGLPRLAFDMFVEMLESGVGPNDFTFNVALHACAELSVVEVGKQLHSMVVRFGIDGDCRTANCLMNMYLSCGWIHEARLIFNKMPERDLVSFTMLISGFCQRDLLESAVGMYAQMIEEGYEPNEYTISSVLMACEPVLGEQINGYMIKTDVDQNVHAASALIEFYSKNFEIERAKLVFDKLEARNVVTWSSIISCCVRHERIEDALKLFIEMVCSGIVPNEYTASTVLAACGLDSQHFAISRQLHCSIIKLNLASDNRVLNALLTMYARSGEIKELEKVFERMENVDVVSRCAVISGYSQNGFDDKSIKLLCQMHEQGHTPNEYGLSSTLSSCANLASLDQGKHFHCLALKLGCDVDVCVANALISMYAKSGSIDDARLAFDVLPNHNTMSWNSLIHGYAYHGHGKKAIEVFEEMVEYKQAVPDHSTFVAILTGCSHVGCVDKAFRYFNIMSDRYGVLPSASHYACMVNMLGRAGRLNEALQIINQMPFEPDVLTWKTLLGACRLHKNLELGTLVAEKVIELSPKDAATYVLLSNMHATHGEWKDVERVRTMMEEKGAKKEAGWSWIEVKSKVNAFVAGDRSHERADSIYLVLDQLLKEMKEEGYSAKLSSISYDFDF